MTVMQADDFMGPYEFVHKDYKPDYEPKKAHPLPGKLQKHGENTSKSTHVWLPIEWDGEKPMIRWYDEWKVEDFI